MLTLNLVHDFLELAGCQSLVVGKSLTRLVAWVRNLIVLTCLPLDFLNGLHVSSFGFETGALFRVLVLEVEV